MNKTPWTLNDQLTLLNVLAQKQEQEDNPLRFRLDRPNNTLPPLQQSVTHFPDGWWRDPQAEDEEALLAELSAEFCSYHPEDQWRLHWVHIEAAWSNRIENIESASADHQLVQAILQACKTPPEALNSTAIEAWTRDWSLPAPGVRKRQAGHRTVIASAGKVIYTPPEGRALILRMLAQWQLFNQAPPPWPAYVSAALSHYQYEAIHPLYDGNGRTGRAILSASLATHYTNGIVLPFSKTLFKQRPQYYQALNAPKTKGDWVSVVALVRRAVIRALSESIEKLRRGMSVED